MARRSLGVNDRLFPLMVENIAIETSAAHIDSVPPAFSSGTSGLVSTQKCHRQGEVRLRRSMSASGGDAPYDIAARQAQY